MPRPPSGSQQKPASAPFPISIENLIVHKYSEQAALMVKADKVAQKLIHDELRDGEFLQVEQPGRYLLHFPNLRPDARELRGSVIAEKISRAIRELNPAAKQISGDDAPPPPRAAAPKPISRPPEPRASGAKTNDRESEEMRKQASAAVAAMTGSGTLSYEELAQTPLGRKVAAEVVIEQWPIWYANQSMIVGHDCVPVVGKESLRNTQNYFRDAAANPIEIRAVIDAVVYERVAELLSADLGGKPMGLVVCPVHASTLAHPKYVSAFLAAGSKIPPEAKKYLMFLVKETQLPVSRIKIRDAAGYLAPRSRGLLVDLPLGVDEINPVFREFGYRGARTSLADFRGDEAAALKQLNVFAEQCEKARLQATIDGLDTRSLTVAARAAGFSYLSGSAIVAEKGADLQGFDLDTLFQ
jgi:hypothetical protein